MKKHIKICAAWLLAMLMLAGCSNRANDSSSPTAGTSNPADSGASPTPDNHELIVPIIDECRVSSKRTGTCRQGVTVLQNGFECTDTGAYWMCENWLLYSDHGSDTVIKLCGRPDCTHSNRDCNAYFNGCNNICYYNGYLYTFGSEGLYRVNLDGSDRLLVFDLPAFRVGLHEKYRGTYAPQIWNGILSFDLNKLNESGKQVSTSFYYKLDGSMEAPKETAVPMWLIKTDGDAFCGCVGYDDEGEAREYIYGIWDPDTDTTTEFFRAPETLGLNYIGGEAMYYIEDGVIYEYTYATDTIGALFDTGLEGTYRVSLFPDVIVVIDYSDDPIEDMTLRFYDWNFQNLGSVHVDFPFPGRLISMICGETHERIMLTDAFDFAPRYYIEKSDLGSGNITIHEYEWDFELREPGNHDYYTGS